MNLIVTFLLIISLVSIILCDLNPYSTSYTEIHDHHTTETIAEDPGGFWTAKRKWKAYWVKDWKVKKVAIPTWKKVWAPVDVNEWVPLAKPPPPTLKPHLHSPIHK